MRALITGAAGQLGRAVTQELRDAGHDVRAYPRGALDVTRAADVRAVCDALQPDVVLNCSAYNRVDDAESHRDLAFAVNADGPAALAREAERHGAVFVHYSTDFVFDGETTRPYAEADEPSPASVYGQSKLAGELNAALASRHYILRLESLFGRQPVGRSTIDWIAGCLARGQEASVFIDRVVSPSYSIDVARATRHLLEQGSAPGLYHCVNSGHCTWYELAEEVASQLGVAAVLRPVRTSEITTGAPRPRFCALSNEKLSASGMRMPTWQSALRRHFAGLALATAQPAPSNISSSVPVDPS